MKDGNSPNSWKTTVAGCPQDTFGLVIKADMHNPARKSCISVHIHSFSGML